MKSFSNLILKGIFLVLAFSSLKVSASEEVRNYIRLGNEAYGNRQYDSALTQFDHALALDSNSSLIHFNLANTYYRLGDIAPSILHYKLAQKLAPGDKDITTNLALAEAKRTDEIEPLPQSIGSHIRDFLNGLLSYNSWLVLCLIFSIAAALGWTLFGLGNTSTQKKIGFISGIVLSLFFILAVLNFSRVHHNFYDKDDAIVFAPSLNVVNEPSESASTLFVLHEGTEVSVKEERNNWLRIRILDGSEGWVLENTVKRY